MKRKILCLIISLCFVFSVFAVIPVTADNANATERVYQGVDVSVYQGSINWKKAAAAGIDFAIIRCLAYREDENFDANYAGAVSAGIDVGAYVYMYATNEAEARAEAEAAVNILSGKNLDYPLYLDVEDNSVLGLGKDTLTSLMITELDIFRKAGFTAGIYTSQSYTYSYMEMSRLSQYELWIARWVLQDRLIHFSDVSSTGSSLLQNAMWQFSSWGNGADYGMSSTRLDMDYCYKEYSSDSATGYRMNSREFMINGCESKSGFSAADGTSVSLEDEKTQGTMSIELSSDSSTANANVNYKNPLDLSEFGYISFDYYLYSGSNGSIEMTFSSENADDFKLTEQLAGKEPGWHTCKIPFSDMTPGGSASDRNEISSLGISFNAGDGPSAHFLVDNIKAIRKTDAATASGNILKVTYTSDGDSGNPGYKYLDLAECTLYTGYSLSYDVFLADDQGGIGGIELDDKYGNYARDDASVMDQNGIAGHPASDISDYAFGRWYHREISLPDGWNGVGYARFYAMLAFDGGFTGTATAYFDNIKIIDRNGNDVEYFFKDDTGEFSYENNTSTVKGDDYSGTFADGINAEVISLEDADIKTLFMYGDINSDSEITATDALMALQAAVGKITLSGSQKDAALVSGGDTVTANDALLILQHSVGKISSFPVEALKTDN